jgi:transposase
MKCRQDDPWHVTNRCISGACEQVKQLLLIRWFDREYVDERDETALHRSRRRYFKARTAQANQICGLLAESGVVVPQGTANIASCVSDLIEDATQQLLTTSEG